MLYVKPLDTFVEATLPSKEKAHLEQGFCLRYEEPPFNPVLPGRARIWHSQGKAAVLKCYAFTIRRKTTVEHPLRIKIDSGSRTSGPRLQQNNTTLPGRRLSCTISW